MSLNRGVMRMFTMSVRVFTYPMSEFSAPRYWIMDRMRILTVTMGIFTHPMSEFSAPRYWIMDPMRILTAAVRIFTALKNKMG